MRFSKALLMDSGRMESHYNNLQISLFCANWCGNNDERHLAKSSLGWCDYDPIIKAIINYNRTFVKLIDIKEPLVALPIVRIQMENLIYLFAEYHNPNKILYKIYDNARVFNQIVIDGEKLKTSTFTDLLDEKYKGIKSIWSRYCCFIHPSKEIDKISYDFDRKIVAYSIKDMQVINQAITDTLNDIIDRFVVEIKAKGEYKGYLDYVKRTKG